MTKPRILLCEDDINLGNVLKVLLEQNDYDVILARDGQEGLDIFKSKSFDLCLLDVMMPKIDGFTLAEKFSQINPDVSFFFLTAKTIKEDVLKGYKLGARDYITKPFDTEVLMIKIKSILNRNGISNQQQEEDNVIGKKNEYKIGKFQFYIKFRKLIIGKQEITLSPKETILLQLLCEKEEDLLDRNEALTKIWGSEAYFNSRSMDVFITKLRKYLSLDPNIQIENIHGSGFRLIVR